MLTTEEMFIRLLIAVFIGMIIGAEREYRNKDAGLRTVTLICVGSCLFTLMSIVISPGTPDRIASNIVTGIGFLGGGVIFKSDSGINGLTTAATVWMIAALGMTVASGNLHVAWLGTAIVLLILYLFTILEKFIYRLNQVIHYRIICPVGPDMLKKYERLMQEYQLQFRLEKQSRDHEETMGLWEVRGSEKKHKQFIDALHQDNTIKKFEY